MSIAALNSSVSAFRADGHITLDEAKTLMSPQTLGAYTDKDEFEVIKRLATDVKLGNLKTATPEVVEEVNANNQARLIDKGVKIGAAVASVVAIIGIVCTAVIPALAASVAYFAMALGAASAIAALGVGIGALAGFIHSRLNPITKSEVEQESPLALAATRFKKNPLVQRGIKIAGAIGGTIGGVGAVGVMTTSVSAAMLGAPASFGLGAGAALVGIILTGISLIIGIGALGGYIHSKIKGAEPEAPVTADVKAAALIEKAVEKGVTAEDHLEKGTKIGGIVGGVLSGLALSIWSIGALLISSFGAAFATVATAEGMLAGGLTLGALYVYGATFAPVAVGALAVIGVAVSIGALVGFIQSKVKKEVD